MKQSEPKLNTLLDVAKRFPTEESCREYLEKARWGSEIVCPHCGCFSKFYRVGGGKLFKCADCRKQFSVKVGTIFEDSALPLQKWFFAIYILTAHKKGISSIQLSKDIGVTQKTAWFMLHRIRYAVKTKSFGKPLNGIVEVDETYVGGKMSGGKRGLGSENKTAVFGMFERDGDVRARPVKHADQLTLKHIIRKNVSPDATIMSDDASMYHRLDEEFKGHEVVNHSHKEYVRGNAHTNNIENFWLLMKRGINGIYHHVSKEHLHAYVDEYGYRYNSRKTKDQHRFASAMGHCDGRLTYEKLIDHS